MYINRGQFLGTTAQLLRPDDGNAADPPADPPVDPSADPPVEPGDRPPPKAAAAPPKPDPGAWKDKELNKKHAQIKERDARIQQLQEENERLRQAREAAANAVDHGGDTTGAAGGDTAQPQVRRASTAPSKEQFDQAVRAEAEALARQRGMVDQIATMTAKGNDSFGKDAFAKAVEQFALVGEGHVSPDTMMGILSTDDPARVIHELGTNPERAQEIFALPPHRQLTEFVKIAMAPPPKKKTSDAPPPVEPVGGSGESRSGELRDEMSDAEWYRVRQAQKRQRFLASQGRAA